MQNTLQYAALVPCLADESFRMVRRGLAVVSVHSDANKGSSVYRVVSDIGEVFIDTEDNLLSLPHSGKGSLYAFGRTGDDAITLLHSFISFEKKSILKRLEDIDHELESIETVQDWLKEKAERSSDTKGWFDASER